ncbi:MAG: hypothetical protein NXI32_25660 [bacterium]|nr:hypothetical protein [bacterium]
MQTLLRGVAAVLAGLIGGSFVNIFLVNIGPLIIPLPEGADVSSMESLTESMPLFKPANFLFPFLGHALGTLVGAFLAALIAPGKKLAFGLGIGLFFLIGGIAAVQMFGGPLWFKVVDLVFAYLPMGWLGAKLAGSRKRVAVTSEEP